jgi:hypothetical protein
MRAMRYFSILWMGTIGSCTTNYTSGPELNALVGQCFATISDSILYQRSCPPGGGLDGKHPRAAYCNTLTNVGAFRFPPTLQSYEANPVEWSAKIASAIGTNGSVFSNPTIVRGAVVKGTTLRIARMYRWFNGENGTSWVTAATIEDGNFKDQYIVLPWQGSFTEPWISDTLDASSKAPSQYPRPDPKYLRPCS